MTILDPSKQKTQKGKNRSIIILFIILLVAAILAYNYTTQGVFTEHSVVDDLNGLVYAFQSIAYGDVNGFFDGLLDSMVVIGLFMVMFALVHFIITTTLKHVFSSKNVQLVMSLVITIYAFVDHRIYNFLISLNAFVVGFFVFCAFIIMLWGFGKHSYKNFKESQHELIKATNVARQQYESKGYVDGDIVSHIKKLKKELAQAQRKYQKDLDDSN